MRNGLVCLPTRVTTSTCIGLYIMDGNSRRPKHTNFCTYGLNDVTRSITACADRNDVLRYIRAPFLGQLSALLVCLSFKVLLRPAIFCFIHAIARVAGWLWLSVGGVVTSFLIACRWRSNCCRGVGSSNSSSGRSARMTARIQTVAAVTLAIKHAVPPRPVCCTDVDQY